MASLKKLLEKVKLLNADSKYNEVIEILPHALLKDYNSAELYSQKAIAYHGLDNYNFTLENAELALIIDPNHIYANYYKGISLRKLKKYDEAINLFNRAIELNPNDAPAYYGLGTVYRDLKIIDEAIQAFKKAIQKDPLFVYPYNGLGNAYFDLKEYDKAIKNYNRAIQIDPEFAYSYYGLGNAYGELKNYDQALEAYGKAILKNFKYAPAYYGLATVYYELTEYDKALDAYIKAIEIDSKFSDAYYGKALVFFVQKQYKKALVDFKKYIDLTRDSPDYYTTFARSKVADLKKLIASEEYSHLSELVNKIKSLLLFNGSCITHYTSLSVAKSLTLESSLFRLSEGAYLNDTSEGRELFNYLSFHMNSRIDNTIAEPFSKKPFIGSFVDESKHDDLTLWRMYGKEAKDEAKGCAITLSKDVFIKNLKEQLTSSDKRNLYPKFDEAFNFYRVAYRKQGEASLFIIPGAKDDEASLNHHMSDLSTKVNSFRKKRRRQVDIQNLSELLNEIAFLFKSAEYQYEHELRLVVKGIGFEKKITTDSTPPKVFIELINIRPAIKEITLGPKVEKADEWASAFFYNLDKDGYNPNILISHLPFK